MGHEHVGITNRKKIYVYIYIDIDIYIYTR